MKRLLRLFLLAFLLVPNLRAEPLPRVVVGLYDGSMGAFQFSNIHQLAEMPLNHLGLIIRPHDLRDGLPDLSDDPQVRGIISWYPEGIQLKNKLAYLKWARQMVRAGKRLVIMGDPGFWASSSAELNVERLSGQLLSEMGIRNLEDWVELTYDHRFSYEDPKMTGFERQELRIKHPYARLEPIGNQVHSYLVIQKGFDPDTAAHLAMAGAKGGYVATGYAMFHEPESDNPVRQWFINPFAFFAQAFGTSDLPKPDTNTLAGSRIFYSHIDGDGWNNRTQMEAYRQRPILSSEVIEEGILKAYPDFPVSVSAIAAELDPRWSGTEEAEAVARRIFALPNVEIGTHTYSHPFQWSFFADGDPDKEKPYLHRYKGGGWGNRKVINSLISLFTKSDESNVYKEGLGLREDYDIPRAYAKQPFDLDLEISGSVQYIEQLAPKGKKAAILMWSGNTSPFEMALTKTRQAGLANINGGDSRMDRKYPSYAWVSSLGRVVGKEEQIYSSNSNENTYTDLWTGGFHGFRYLANTIFNTESPIRVKPFNIYYHMYSGERQASFNALIDNIELAKSQRLVRIEASLYSRLASGFFSAQILPLGKDRWEIGQRKDLQTIRFDQASLKTVDYRRSSGVVGHHYLQGSLYVYLDQAHNRPVIALKNFDLNFEPQRGQIARLDWGTWIVTDLERKGRQFQFKTRGWGPGQLRWVVDPKIKYQVRRADGGALSSTLDKGMLMIQIPGNQPEPIALIVTEMP
ncbi:MAG: hypothetical protein RRB13_02075 [bacterium]|nr:hypothetical protein [bacterium]